MVAIDYDPIAPHYDQRYHLHSYPGVRAILRGVVAPGLRVLELGCGTGEWLAELDTRGCHLFGIDPSESMLALAARRSRADLRRGVAEALPWARASLDVVFCVNSFHHFSAPDLALAEAFRVLKPGGTFLSVGLDPHENRDRWYVYDFFPETLAADRKRFPSQSVRLTLLHASGFAQAAVHIAEHLVFSHPFDEALRDGVLEPSFTSQLTALSPNAYQMGLDRARHAAAADPSFRLETDLILYATRAARPG